MFFLKQLLTVKKATWWSNVWGTVLSKQVDNKIMQILRKSRNSESNYY